MPKVICFANMKGGVGKTTLCVNLAFEIFRSGKKVLIVDNDPQFNATSALLKPQKYLDSCIKDAANFKTTYDVYEQAPRVAGQSSKKLADNKFFIRTWYMKNNPNVYFDLLASRIDLYETLRNPSHKEYLLDKFLKANAGMYDYILIDCPPTPSVLTLSAFAASDFVLIPATPDYFSTFGLAQFLGTLLDFKENLHDTHKIRPLGLVFTRVPRIQTNEIQSSIARVIKTLSELSSDLEVPVFDARLSYFKVYEKALWQSMPVQQVSGKGTRGKQQSAHELIELSNELHNRIAQLTA